MLKAVLFDLDGTLLPMVQDVFVRDYFGRLARHLAPYGYDAEKLISAIWTGTGAMVKNNGECTNEQAFWNTFCQIFGESARQDEPHFAEFYATEFDKVRSVCGYMPKAAETVRKIKAMGLRVSLATNPIFPAMATESRIRWAGLEPEEFEGYTTYENSSFCKPNLAYYKQILKRLALQPHECLMVGNDVGEDMVASQLGMDVFLLTYCLINREEQDISQYPHGDFAKLMAYIEERQRAND